MAAKKKKNLGGRPTKFDPTLIPKVRKFMLMSATMEQLADFLGVNKSQIYRWMSKDAGFRTAVTSGREEADANVAKSMYKRAVGMRVKATKIFYDKDAAAQQKAYAYEAARQMKIGLMEGMQGELTKEEKQGVSLTLEEYQRIDDQLAGKAGIVAVPYYEVLPPDVKAGMFWLNNRRSEHWKDRQTVDQNVTGDVQHIIDWVEAPDCEPLKTAEELEAEENNLNPRDATNEDEH